jgi:hypothetical protein
LLCTSLQVRRIMGLQSPNFHEVRGPTREELEELMIVELRKCR